MAVNAFTMPPAETADESNPRRRKRNPRGQGSRLREEIIQATSVLLERTANEESVTLRAIAREIGIASPSINSHFADRMEILDAVIAREVTALYEMLAAAVASRTDPVDRFLAAVRAYYHYGVTRPSRYRLLLGRRFLPDWNEDRQMTDSLQVTGAAFQMVVSLIQDCIDARRSSNADASTTAVSVWAVLHGVLALPNSITTFPWPDMEQVLEAAVIRIAGLDVAEH